MSGIVGLWNFNGAPIDVSLLQRLTAAIAHRGPDAQGFWVDGPVGVAACLLRVAPESLHEVQPAVRPGEAVVVFDGRLDNREEILAETQFSGAISAASSDSALVLAAYCRYGDKFVERLNGDFACAVFDIRRRQLLLARDYLGIRPLYYARAGDTFLFASEIKAILAYPGFPRVPNEDALAVFLAQGISQDARGQTLFSGVLDCPPARLLTVTPSKTLVTRHWSFENISVPPAKSPSEHLENFRWHFERAVRRRIRSAYPVAVSVSGGLDSSSVFCVAETLRRSSPSSVAPIVGVTQTYPQASPADERHYIAAIERQFGVKIVDVPAEASGPDSSRTTQLGIWHTELPLLDAQWNESHVFYQAVAATGSRVMLSGHPGDLVAGEQSHLVDLFNHFKFAELWARLREFPRWTTDFVPGFHTQQFLQDLLRYQKKWLPEVVVRTLRRLRARHHLSAPYNDRLRRLARQAEWCKSEPASSRATFHAQSLGSRMQSRVFLTGFEENNKAVSAYGMEIAYPFADRDVLSFVMGVPPEVYSAGAVPRGIVRQALQSVLPSRIAGRRDKADFGNYINTAVGAQYAGIVSALQGDSKIFQRGFVDCGSFRCELERWNAEIQLQGPTCEAAWKLQRLYRLELWLQTFFEESGKNYAEARSCTEPSATLSVARQ